MHAARPTLETGRRPAATHWQLAAAPAGSSPADLDGLDWLDACVPGTAADALRRANRWDWDARTDFDACDWWWRARIDAGEHGDGMATLGFDGLATLADAWLDGEPILRSENMFAAHRLPVRLSGTHELLIRCAALAPELAKKRPRPRWRVPMLAQQQLRWFRTSLLGRTPGWSPPCPVVGPWREVWIARGLHGGDPVLRSRLENGVGRIDVALALPGDAAATLLVERAGRVVGEAPFERDDGIDRATLRIATPDLWWPHTHGEPALHDVNLVLRRGPDVETIALGRTGFRDLRIVRDGGDFAVHVNGVAVFCRGACWTPLDVVGLQAADADCRTAVAQVRDAGMNMLRVSGAMVYEGKAFHDALDEYGILLWQDFMFANMDYPEDEAFERSVLAEVDAQIARLGAHPSLALFCGNSEVGQQAAMGGAPRDAWSPRLFHQTIADRVAAAGIEYVPSSTHGGAFPHAANAGVASYYGVGAYLHPLTDARRAEPRFASECLAFANIPDDSGLPGGPALRVHHAAWKARSPRDLGAGWDFDDVRDHYVRQFYGVDPTEVRTSDHDRYLALGRHATGEAMAAAFSEWRRQRAPTRGALVWFLRDLWPGAGWGVVDAHGLPKPCWYALRRALAPLAVAISDEGVNGLAVHVFNDGARAFQATLELAMYRHGEIEVCKGALPVAIPAHAAVEIPASDFLDGFYDLSHAYRFGPPLADVAHVVLREDGSALADAFAFPTGLPSRCEREVGLAVEVEVAVEAASTGTERAIVVSARRFAQNVTIAAPGYIADDNGFHLAPGQRRRIVLRAAGTPPPYARYAVSALNAESGVRFELP